MCEVDYTKSDQGRLEHLPKRPCVLPSPKQDVLAANKGDIDRLMASLKIQKGRIDRIFFTEAKPKAKAKGKGKAAEAAAPADGAE